MNIFKTETSIQHKKTLKETFHLIKDTTIHQSIAPRSNIKIKRFLVDRITPQAMHIYNLLAEIYIPSPTLHLDPTITNIFALEIFMDPLSVEQIFAKIHTEKNENISFNLNLSRR